MVSNEEITPDLEGGREYITSTDSSLGHPIEFPNEKLTPAHHDATLDIEEVTPSTNKWLQWTRHVERLFGLEARGIHCVKAHEQTPETSLDFMQILILWFSINTGSQNITLASIGQSVYGLGFLDATLCSVLGAVLGSIPVAYTAGWGPWSGNRTMVCSFSQQFCQKRLLLITFRSVLVSQWAGGP